MRRTAARQAMHRATVWYLSHPVIYLHYGIYSSNRAIKVGKLENNGSE